MNKNEFQQKFQSLNPRLMWDMDGPKRDGEKAPIFILQGYAINGYIVIRQDWGENGSTLYYPAMNNSWDKSWEDLQQIAQGVKPYITRKGNERALYDGNIYGSYTLFVDGKPEVLLNCGEDEAKDYTDYVNAKLDIDEDPLTLDQWRDFNESSKES